MGFFSWLDENGSPIRNEYTEKPSKCRIFLPDDRVLNCSKYGGYGDFTDDETGETIDFYLECARANGAGDDRDEGIRIGLDKPPGAKLPRIASWGFSGGYDDLEDSPEDPNQGYWG